MPQESERYMLHAAGLDERDERVTFVYGALEPEEDGLEGYFSMKRVDYDIGVTAGYGRGIVVEEPHIEDGFEWGERDLRHYKHILEPEHYNSDVMIDGIPDLIRIKHDVTPEQVRIVLDELAVYSDISGGVDRYEGIYFSGSGLVEDKPTFLKIERDR